MPTKVCSLLLDCLICRMLFTMALATASKGAKEGDVLANKSVLPAQRNVTMELLVRTAYFLMTSLHRKKAILLVNSMTKLRNLYNQTAVIGISRR